MRIERKPCVICGTPGSAVGSEEGFRVTCKRCGHFRINREVVEDFQKDLLNELTQAKLSHQIRKASDRNTIKDLVINSSIFQSFLDNGRFYRPTEQTDNLIIWLGTKNSELSVMRQLSLGEIASIVGAPSDPETLHTLILDMQEFGWIGNPYATLGNLDSNTQLRLTFQGWRRFDELTQSPKDVRRAFMAMAFRDTDGLPRAYAECFKPAVADAGFQLERLDENQGAGLIDDQLRVAIRTSKFLIADLTTRNRGAYWEAGFAEGLGKPVIYVCNDSIWASDDPDIRPHFDTNHLLTIIWSLDNLDNARRQLTATIRNTFPSEAKLE